MADYPSILNRAISSLSDNTEETRRTIYDKARAALMRQLSSLEPALSPAEISRQRLQLEEAVRHIENQYTNAETSAEEAVVESAVVEPTPEALPEPVAETTPVDEAPSAIEQPSEPETEQPSEPEAAPFAEAPVIEQTDSSPQPEEITPTVAPVVDPSEDVPPSPEMQTPSVAEENAPVPVETPTPIEVAPVEETPAEEPSITPAPEVVVDQPSIAPDTDSMSDTHVALEPEAPVAEAPRMPEVTDAPEFTESIAPNEDAETVSITPEIDDDVASASVFDAAPPSALDELRETLRQDGVDLSSSPTPDVDFTNTNFESGSTEAPEVALDDDIDVVQTAAKRRTSGAGLILILAVLIIIGAGAFGWAQRDVLRPVLGPYFEQAKTSVTSFISSLNQEDTPENRGAEQVSTQDEAFQKAEDRILNTPLETAGKTTAPSNVEQGTKEATTRVTLPERGEEAANLPQVRKVEPETPAATTPLVEADNTTANAAAPSAPETAQQPENVESLVGRSPQSSPQAPQRTPTVNIFSASAVLYEEKANSNNPDVSTGNVLWEYRPTGSEAIGSTGLPSVRGGSVIQNRDLKVRFEIMRNLDSSLPASHLVEIEFEEGPLFGNDPITNVAGILMKNREESNGKQLTGVVVKVSDHVFWVALSAQAADLASNVDALKNQLWFDVPIVFESGKRAILTLEKSTAGAKAITRAFEGWEQAAQ